MSGESPSLKVIETDANRGANHLIESGDLQERRLPDLQHECLELRGEGPRVGQHELERPARSSLVGVMTGTEPAFPFRGGAALGGGLMAGVPTC